MLIPRSVLPITKICDRDSARYALGAVEISRTAEGDPIACATDGRRLLALTWQEPPAAEFPAAGVDLAPRPGAPPLLIPAAAVDSFAKCKIGAKHRKPILQHIALEEPADPLANSIRAAATDCDQTANFSPKLQEGRFPRWRDCIPPAGAVGEMSVSVSARLLRELLEVIEQHGAGDQSAVTITIIDHKRPVVITAESADGRRAVGALMPLENGVMPPADQWRAGVQPITPADSPDSPDDPTDLEPEAAAVDTVIEPPAASPAPAPSKPARATRRPASRESAAALAPVAVDCVACPDF